MRQRALGALGVDEDVGRIGALVDGGTAQLDEPDRLGLRNPRRRRGRAHATGTIVVRAGPEVAHVLGAMDPRFVIGAVCDGRARLRGAIGLTGVEPLIRLARFDAALEIGRIVDGRRQRRIEMRAPVAPVAERGIPVDADRIDGRVRPQRIEVKEHVARPVLRAVASVFRPVRSVSELCRWPHHRAHVRSNVAERGDGRIARGAVARRGEPAQFRADDQRIDARKRGELGVMQDEAAIGPFARSRIVRHAAADAEMRRSRGAEEGRELRRSGGGLVRRAGLAWRGMERDPPAPWIDGLLASAVRIGQSVAGGHIHQQEGIERHLVAARLQFGDRSQHSVVAWRAAEGRRALELAHHMRAAAVDTAGAPGNGRGELDPHFDAGAYLAFAAAQIVSEPRRDQHHCFAIRKVGRELIERDQQIRAVALGVHVLGGLLARPHRAQHRLGRVHKLARARDEADALDALIEARRLARRGTHDLERELRHGIAEALQRHVLEHDIGKPAIGRRVLCAFDGFDQRVGRLIFRACVQPPGEFGQVQRLAVGPDAPDARDLAFAQADREGERVAKVGDGRARPALAADIACFGALLEARGPDHLPGDAHAAEHRRDRGAFGRTLQMQVGQPRAFVVRRQPEQLLIDRAPEPGAAGAAERCANAAPHARQAAANRLADSGEN